MAENRIVSVRFQRRLAEELDIDNPAPVPVLAPEIVPVMVVESERPELLHLMAEHRFSSSFALAGVAAEYTYYHLWNPANSGIIAVVEEFAIAAGSSDDYDFGPAVDTFIASLGARAGYALDARLPQNPLGRPCMCEPYAGTDPNTGGVSSFARVRGLANQTCFVKNLNYVLDPGAGFGIFCGTVNVTRGGYIWWRERKATNGELV